MCEWSPNVCLNSAWNANRRAFSQHRHSFHLHSQWPKRNENMGAIIFIAVRSRRAGKAMKPSPGTFSLFNVLLNSAHIWRKMHIIFIKWLGEYRTIGMHFAVESRRTTSMLFNERAFCVVCEGEKGQPEYEWKIYALACTKRTHGRPWLSYKFYFNAIL